MKDPKIRVCWFCLEIFPYERVTAHYCSDTCRAKDFNKCKKEIEAAVSELKLKQETERKIKSGRIFIDYMEKMENK